MAYIYMSGVELSGVEMSNPLHVNSREISLFLINFVTLERIYHWLYIACMYKPEVEVHIGHKM